MNTYSGIEVAVIGMSGRFPGAEDVQAFWNNLVNGVESIHRLSDEELLAEGEDKDILDNPQYVKANAFLNGKEYFDSNFFGYRPEEARLMNPQTRLFHEVCWHALEDAGYDARNNTEKIGLFAGGSTDVNWQNYTFLSNEDNLVDDYTASHLRDISYLCSRVSYMLNLQGPAVYVNTACSTSLVAVQRAAMSLLLRECSMALAGGICINNFSKKGYLFQEGMINSPDGHCRTFDTDAKGTVGGEGVGVVVLKRLADAMQDGDHIYAVIKGHAVNNDGNQKISFTAPGIEGQHRVITKALGMAQIAPQSISYIEAHGTATELGDPVEVEALNKSFGPSTEKYCALGAVKSNIGHLDTAAGVAGFIKTVLALKNRKLPASLHFTAPNPKINFTNSPFYVNSHTKEWRQEQYPLRAGVSSFGIGGTNAHVILEEAPAETPSDKSRAYQLLLLSGKTNAAQDRNTARFKQFLDSETNASMADIAFTLQTGRTAMEYRRMVVCTDKSDALQQLQNLSPAEPAPIHHKNKPTVVFMFPGQGAQYAGMFDELYPGESIFREAADKCITIVENKCGKDLRPILFAHAGSATEKLINHTEFAQPALFIMEYALAQLLMSWGIQPDVMIGHSIGEYVAATVSGAFSLEDALTLVVKRGELMQRATPGSMLSISITEDELHTLLNGNGAISLAAINSPELCVVSGKTEDIERIKQKSDQLGYNSRILKTSHAFHSYMMDEVLEEFGKEVSKVSIRAGKIPFISNLTGDWAIITQPKYWVDHLRNTIRYKKGMDTLLQQKNGCFIEVGPGNALGTFVRSNTLRRKEHTVIQLIQHAHGTGSQYKYLLRAVGELWLQGIQVNWNNFYRDEKRKRVSLPGYSFDKTEYPVIVNAFKMISERIAKADPGKDADIRNWLYTPSWKLCAPAPVEISAPIPRPVLLLMDEHGLCESLTVTYEEQGVNNILVRKGSQFREWSPVSYELNPADPEGAKKLFAALSRYNLMPDRLIHGWGVDIEASPALSPKAFDERFYIFVELIKAYMEQAGGIDKQVVLLTNRVYDVLDKNSNAGLHSLCAGLLKVVAQEYPGVRTCHIDVNLDETAYDHSAMLYAEIARKDTGRVVCLRQERRWEQIYDKIAVTQDQPAWPCKQHGVYLVTGGLGSFGFHISKYLLQTYHARVILIGRTGLSQPAGEALSETLKIKQQRYLSLQKEPGAVMYIDCEVSNREALTAAIRAGESRFGPINAVIHAAGVIRGASINTLSELTKTDFEEQFASKVYGLAALHAALAHKNLDFCLLISSLSVVLGGLGFSAYASANTFMDHYINSFRKKGELPNWISVDLDALSYDDASAKAITTRELIDVIALVLHNTQLSQIVVSVSNLNKRLDNWVSMQSNQADQVKTAIAKPAVTSISENTQQQTASNGVEITLVHLWQQFFGKAEIDIADDFFDIGGDSLKALTMIARIKKQFNIELSITSFFQFSSIQKLAVHISSLIETDNSSHTRQQLQDHEQFIF